MACLILDPLMMSSKTKAFDSAKTKPLVHADLCVFSEMLLQLNETVVARQPLLVRLWSLNPASCCAADVLSI